jgi:hypothetical protein
LEDVFWLAGQNNLDVFSTSERYALIFSRSEQAPILENSGFVDTIYGTSRILDEIL